MSVRELEVLNEISLGITNREIAERLCISGYGKNTYPEYFRQIGCFFQNDGSEGRQGERTYQIELQKVLGGQGYISLFSCFFEEVFDSWNLSQ